MPWISGTIMAVGGLASTAMAGDGGDAPDPVDWQAQMEAQYQYDKKAMRQGMFNNNPTKVNDFGQLGMIREEGELEYSDADQKKLNILKQKIASAQATGDEAEVSNRLFNTRQKITDLEASLAEQQALNTPKSLKLAAKLQAKITALQGKAAKYEADDAKIRTKNIATWQRAIDTLKPTSRAPDKWTQTEKLDPRLTEANQAFMDKAGVLAENLRNRGEFQGDEQVQWDDQGYQKYADDIYNSTMNRLQPEQDHEMAARETQLAQRGIMAGTAAYDRAMQQLQRSQGDVKAKAALDARMAAQQAYIADVGSRALVQGQNYGQDVQDYMRPYDEIAANQGVMQGYSPTFKNSGSAAAAAAPDVIGAAQRSSQDAWTRYGIDQQNSANRAGAYSQAFSTIGNAVGKYMDNNNNNNNNSGGGYWNTGALNQNPYD
jgi:hypothetical protein